MLKNLSSKWCGWFHSAQAQGRYVQEAIIALSKTSSPETYQSILGESLPHQHLRLTVNTHV